MQGYKSEFRSTSYVVIKPVFIGVVVGLMSLGPFCCILLLCYDFITELVIRYPAVIIFWLCLGQPYSTPSFVAFTVSYTPPLSLTTPLLVEE